MMGERKGQLQGAMIGHVSAGSVLASLDDGGKEGSVTGCNGRAYFGKETRRYMRSLLSLVALYAATSLHLTRWARKRTDKHASAHVVTPHVMLGRHARTQLHAICAARRPKIHIFSYKNNPVPFLQRPGLPRLEQLLFLSCVHA